MLLVIGQTINQLKLGKKEETNVRNKRKVGEKGYMLENRTSLSRKKKTQKLSKTQLVFGVLLVSQLSVKVHMKEEIWSFVYLKGRLL